MNITSITYENLSTGIISGAQSYLYANSGEKVKVTILFTQTNGLPTIPTRADYFFGFIDASASIYPLGSADFIIQESQFNHLNNSILQKYEGNLASLEPSEPKGFDSSVTPPIITSLGGNDYRLEHVFYFPYFLDFDNTTATEYVKPDKKNDRRFVFRLGLKDSINPNYLDSTNGLDLTSLLLISTIGFYDSNYNFGKPYFEVVNNFDFTDFNPYQDNYVTFQIQKKLPQSPYTPMAWANTDKVDIFFQSIKAPIDANKTFLENNKIERLEKLANGITNSSGIFNSCVVNIETDTSIVTVSFTIPSGYLVGYERCAFWFNCSSISIAQDSNNTLPILFEVDKSKINTTAFNIPDIQFLHFGETTISSTNTYNALKLHQSDEVVAKMSASLSDPTITFTKIEFGVKNFVTNEAIESFAFLVDATNFPSLPTTKTVYRERTRNTNNIANRIVLSNNAGAYSVEYGFQYLDTWQTNNLCTYIKVYFTQNGNTDYYEKRSPEIEVSLYGISKNINPEVLPDTIVPIQFYKLSDLGTPLPNMVRGEDMLVEFFYKDFSGGNDIQANASDLLARIEIFPSDAKNNKSVWRACYSFQDAESFSPFEEVPTHTPTRIKIEKKDPTGNVVNNYAKLSIIVKWNNLVAIFGDKPSYCFEYNLDKVQSNEYIIEEYSFSYKQGGLSSFSFNPSYPMLNVQIIAGVGSNVNVLRFYFNNVQYSYAIWQTLLSNASNTDLVRIDTIDSFSGTMADSHYILQWTKAGTYVDAYYPLALEFANTGITNECIVPFDKKIIIDPATNLPYVFAILRIEESESIPNDIEIITPNSAFFGDASTGNHAAISKDYTAIFKQSRIPYNDGVTNWQYQNTWGFNLFDLYSNGTNSGATLVSSNKVSQLNMAIAKLAELGLKYSIHFYRVQGFFGTSSASNPKSNVSINIKYDLSEKTQRVKHFDEWENPKYRNAVFGNSKALVLNGVNEYENLQGTLAASPQNTALNALRTYFNPNNPFTFLIQLKIFTALDLFVNPIISFRVGNYTMIVGIRSIKVTSANPFSNIPNYNSFTSVLSSTFDVLASITYGGLASAGRAGVSSDYLCSGFIDNGGYITIILSKPSINLTIDSGINNADTAFNTSYAFVNGGSNSKIISDSGVGNPYNVPFNCFSLSSANENSYLSIGYSKRSSTSMLYDGQIRKIEMVQGEIYDYENQSAVTFTPSADAMNVSMVRKAMNIGSFIPLVPSNKVILDFDANNMSTSGIYTANSGLVSGLDFTHIGTVSRTFQNPY